MNIVITGASSGIGLACAKRCLAAGHRVVATARRAEDLAQLRALGCEAVVLELCDAASVSAAAEAVTERCGGQIDVVFNNAGYGLQVALEDATHEALTAQLQANVIGQVCFTNALLPALRAGSKLVFNSSILGVVVMPLRGPYCMSKFALEAAADAYRLELASRGIRVTVIQPGPIAAKFRRNAYAALQRCLGAKDTRLDYSNHVQRLQSDTFAKAALPAEAVAELFLAVAEGRRRRSRYLLTRTAIVAACLKRLLGSGFYYIARRTEPLRESGR